MKNAWMVFWGLSLTALAASGCNAPDAGSIQGQDEQVHPPIAVSTGTGTAAPTTETATAIGPNCHSSDTTRYCLALKYVVYKDSSGTPVVTDPVALSNLTAINQVWSQCKISFQIDGYLAVDPAIYGLAFDTANLADLDSIRKAFSDSTTLFVGTTGAWDRAGTLGNTAANAWTNMPGDGLYGAILEAPVGNYPNIIAHELGHYLNLAHVSDQTDVMNPVVYTTSTLLTAAQCTSARAAVAGYWGAMLR